MQTARHSVFIFLRTVQIVALAVLIATIVACKGGSSSINPPNQPEFGFIVYSGYVSVPSNVIPGSVSAYSVNTATGTLASIAGSMLDLGIGVPEGIGATAQGSALFVGVGDGIHVFRVSATDGMLTPVLGSPFSPQIQNDVCCGTLAVDPGGRFVLAAGTKTITTFSLDPSSLALTDLQDTTISDFASDLKIDSSGGFLYALTYNQIAVFQLSSTGVPTILQSLTPTNCGTGGYLALDPARRFLYALDFVPDAQGIPRSVITPSTKLMTLFSGRRIGRGVRENNSSPTWA